TDGRGQPGRHEPDDVRTPARDLGAPATREKAHDTPSARARPASKLGIHADARASARRTRQTQGPASRGSCPCVCAVAGILRFLRLSPRRVHAWQRLQYACALDDQSSDPRTSPLRLTPPEVLTIKAMVTAPE